MNIVLKNKKGYTDYEIQQILEQKGYKLYYPEIDNQVDNEKLVEFAIKEGFHWNESKELWFLKEVIK